MMDPRGGRIGVYLRRTFPLHRAGLLHNKKDSTEKHIIMDYRKLNQYTVCDNNPLLNIQLALEQLHGKRLFSKFDI